MYTPIALLVLVIQLAGGELTYTVQKEDSLHSLGARFGVDARVLANENGLEPDKRLAVGQVLKIDNRHIVPPADGATIVINVPQRMLFHFSSEQNPTGYPIAAGRRTWKTELGHFQVVTMERNPTWDVPVSIQNEMQRNGKPVLTHVPPSPANPLGSFWIGLSMAGVGIHGTNAPSSIYGLVTHGCIRLHPDDIRMLFGRVTVGTRGRIIYEPVMLTRADDRIFVEVHPDGYKKGGDPLQTVLEAARTGGFLDLIDLELVTEVVQKKDGIARDVSRRAEVHVK
jgi:L,D-transpeptidase ErfK/SrfK